MKRIPDGPDEHVAVEENDETGRNHKEVDESPLSDSKSLL
jgi:hypothetical protein